MRQKAKITIGERVVFKPVFNGLIEIENALIPVKQAGRFLSIVGLNGARIELIEGC